MEYADAVIIGSGQGGVPLAADLAQQGQKVVLFERGSLGGSCINYGCTPSKAFLASAHAASQTRSMPELGLKVKIEVDFPAVMERVGGMIGSFSKSVEQRLDKAGVRVVKAEAAFTGERMVTGDGFTVQAPTVVINTGKSSLVPDIPGLAGTPYLTAQNFWGLTELPRRMLVLGGGYVGLELGQGIARLGSETHIIDRKERIISAEEPEVSEILTEVLKNDGIHLYHGVKATEVAYNNKEFSLTLSNGETLKGDALLIAIGLKPNTKALKPEAGGIEVDRQGHIKVDDHFHTNVDGVYAIGDVIGQPAFTHVSWEDYRRLRAILNGEERRQGDRVLGYAFFTEPQVGRAGLTLDTAKKQGYAARAVTMPLERVARAIETGYKQGFYRMVVDEKTDKILGATLVGPETAELVHIFIAHMEAGSTWQVLERSVHIHPAYAEALPTLARMLKEDNRHD